MVCNGLQKGTRQMSKDEMVASDGRCLFRLHSSAAILDATGRLLLVQEQKKASYGKWNLPGGHIDHGESPVAAALRETAEETHLSLQPSHLLGIYATHRATRFVVVCPYDGKVEPRAGDEILAVRWFAPAEILAMPDDQLVAPVILRQILADLAANRQMPLSTITHLV